MPLVSTVQIMANFGAVAIDVTNKTNETRNLQLRNMATVSSKAAGSVGKDKEYGLRGQPTQLFQLKEGLQLQDILCPRPRALWETQLATTQPCERPSRLDHGEGRSLRRVGGHLGSVTLGLRVLGSYLVGDVPSLASGRINKPGTCQGSSWPEH
eukprot:scaffold293_cov267-Prasinococcus_capsulatus_cf.AAC.7